MAAQATSDARDASACSPRRTALEEIHVPVQSAGTGWPLLGPDSATDVGPNARKWADKLQKYASAPRLQGGWRKIY